MPPKILSAAERFKLQQQKNAQSILKKEKEEEKKEAFTEEFFYDDFNDENHEDEDEGNEILMEEYKEYWRKKYDPKRPELTLPGQLQRERLLKKPGEWEKMREESIPKLKQTVESRKAKTAFEKMKEVTLCQNIDKEERKNIPPELFISLIMKIKKDDKDNIGIERNTRKVCYRIDNLYSYLTGKYGRNPQNWIDPYTKMSYTKSQKDRINERFNKLYPCRAYSSYRDEKRSEEISGTFKVETYLSSPRGNMNTHRIQIPDEIYNKILSREDLNSNPPVFLLNNYTPETIGKNIKNAKAIFVGLDDISSHSGKTIRISPTLLNELKIKNGDNVYITNCLGLPIATEIFLKPRNKEKYESLSPETIEGLRLALEELISDNFYVLQIPQTFTLDLFDSEILIDIVKIINQNGDEVLSAISAVPGGLQLDLVIL